MDQQRSRAREILLQLKEGKPWSGEFLVQARDRRVFPAFISDSPLLDTDGNLIGFIGVSNDITQLKQADAARKASEQRYRDLAENFPNGVVTIYNRDLNLVFDAGLELKASGYTAEDFLGKHFTELAPPETWETARSHLLAAFGGPMSQPMRPQAWAGQHYSVSVAPIHSPRKVKSRKSWWYRRNITSLRKCPVCG